MEDDFIYFLFQLLIECGEDLCRKCSKCPSGDSEMLCDNLKTEDGRPVDRICLQGIRETFERSKMSGEIFFSEKNIHGEWVIYGILGIRKYSGYPKREALNRYREECRQKLFFARRREIPGGPNVR